MDVNVPYNPNLSRNPMRKGLLRRQIPLDDSASVNRLPKFPQNMPGTYNRSPSQLCRTLMGNISPIEKRDGSSRRAQPAPVFGEPRSFLGECPIETRDNYRRRAQPKISRDPVKKCLFPNPRQNPLNDSNVPSCSRFPTLPSNMPGTRGPASQICRTLMQRSSPRQRRASSSSRAQPSANAEVCPRVPKASASSHAQLSPTAGECRREPRDTSRSNAQPSSNAGECRREPRDTSRSHAQPSSNAEECRREPRDTSRSHDQPSSNPEECPREPRDSPSSYDHTHSNAEEEARVMTPCRIFPRQYARSPRQAFPLARTFQTRSKPREASCSRRPDPGSNSAEQSRETEGTCSRLPEPGSHSGGQSRETEGTCSRLPEPDSREEAQNEAPCRRFPADQSFRPTRRDFPLNRSLPSRSGSTGITERQNLSLPARTAEEEGTCYRHLLLPDSNSGEDGRNAAPCSRFPTDSSRPTPRDVLINRSLPLRSLSTGIAERRNLSLPVAPCGQGRSLSNSSIPLTNQEHHRRERSPSPQQSPRHRDPTPAERQRPQYGHEGRSLDVSEIRDREAEEQYDRRLLPPAELQNANRPWPYGVRGRQLNMDNFRDNRRRAPNTLGGRPLQVSEMQELERQTRPRGWNRSLNLSEFQDDSTVEQSGTHDGAEAESPHSSELDTSSIEQPERRDDVQRWYDIPARGAQDGPSQMPCPRRGRPMDITQFQDNYPRTQYGQHSTVGRPLPASTGQNRSMPARIGTSGTTPTGARRPLQEVQDGSAPSQPPERVLFSFAPVSQNVYGEERIPRHMFEDLSVIHDPLDYSMQGQPSEQPNVCQTQNAQREPFQICEDSPPRQQGQPSEQPNVCQTQNAQRELPFQICEDSPPRQAGQPSAEPSNVCQTQNAQSESTRPCPLRVGKALPASTVHDRSLPERYGTSGGVGRSLPVSSSQNRSLPAKFGASGGVRRPLQVLQDQGGSAPSQPPERVLFTFAPVPQNVYGEERIPRHMFEDLSVYNDPLDYSMQGQPSEQPNVCQIQNAQREVPFQICEDSLPRQQGQPSTEPSNVCQTQNAQSESTRPCPLRAGTPLPVSTVRGQSLPLPRSSRGRPLDITQFQDDCPRTQYGQHSTVGRSLPASTVRGHSLPARVGTGGSGGVRRPLQEVQDGSAPSQPPERVLHTCGPVSENVYGEERLPRQMFEDLSVFYDPLDYSMQAQPSEEPNVCQTQNAQRELPFQICEDSPPRPAGQPSEEPSNVCQIQNAQRQMQYGQHSTVGRPLPASTARGHSLPARFGTTCGAGRPLAVSQVQDGSAPGQATEQVLFNFDAIPQGLFGQQRVPLHMVEYSSYVSQTPWTLECSHFEDTSNPQYQSTQEEGQPSEEANIFLQVPSFGRGREPSFTICGHSTPRPRPPDQPSEVSNNYLQVPNFQRELSFGMSPARLPPPCTPEVVCRNQIAPRELSYLPVYGGSMMQTSVAPGDALPEPSSALYRTFTMSNVSQGGQSSQGEECDRTARPVPLSDFAYNALQTLSSGTIDQDQCQFPQRSISQTASRPQTSEIPPPPPPIRRHPFFDKLVKDTYYPGLIVDSVNGLTDFNEISFSATFRCLPTPEEIDPESVPMSLLEAFDLRIAYEKELRDDLERRRYFCSEEFLKEKQAANQENQQHIDDNYPQWTHRDDHKLASTIDIDMTSRVASYPETPLTESIACLLKAEKMNLYDRNVSYAEEAISGAVDGEKELAALKSTCSFKMELRKDAPTSSKSFERLAIISYIGTTKPNND